MKDSLRYIYRWGFVWRANPKKDNVFTADSAGTIGGWSSYKFHTAQSVARLKAETPFVNTDKR